MVFLLIFLEGVILNLNYFKVINSIFIKVIIFCDLNINEFFKCIGDVIVKIRFFILVVVWIISLFE